MHRLMFSVDIDKHGTRLLHVLVHTDYNSCLSLCCRFAMEESILTLVRLAQKFTFSLDAEKHGNGCLLHSSLITYMPRDGIWLHVQPR